LRGTGIIQGCRALWFVGLLFLSQVSFAQNLESESYYSIQERVSSTSQVATVNLHEIFLEILEDSSEVLERLYLDLTAWRSHHQDIPSAEPYRRLDHFGRWVNDPTDDSCFNTRGMVLERDSQTNVSVSPNNHCKIEGGLWHDPYTNKKIRIANDIQIDHVVPLKNAYMSGAFKWDNRTRCLYANYLGNDYHLLSVDGHENMSKGDRSPVDYMPPQKEYRCEYLKTWLKIKLIWGLNMSDYEALGLRDAMKENGCTPSSFRMTLNELRKQRKIIKEIDYVCRK
jgi:hypothetical protein